MNKKRILEVSDVNKFIVEIWCNPDGSVLIVRWVQKVEHGDKYKELKASLTCIHMQECVYYLTRLAPHWLDLSNHIKVKVSSFKRNRSNRDTLRFSV